MYGSQLATSAKATRPWPTTVIAGSKRAAALGEDPGERADEGDVAGPLAVAAAEVVDAADELGVEPEPGAEREAAAVDAAERDPPLGASSRRACARDRVARKPSARGRTLVAAARDEADGHVAVEAVDDLVEAAVAAEDVDPLVPRRGRLGELGGVPR